MSGSFTHNLPKRTLVLAEFTRLRDEIGVWAKRNFDVHLPELGIAEEVGELTHAILKREQRIRKSVTDQTTKLIEDALADATIYALHLAYTQKLSINFTNELVPIDQEFELLGLLHRTCGTLILNIHHFHSLAVVAVEHASLMTSLWNMASLYDSNLLNLTIYTWNFVSKRDWRKFPQNGLTA